MGEEASGENGSDSEEIETVLDLEQTPTPVSESEIFKDMLRHMMAPLMLGMLFGSFWQIVVMPKIDIFPNPIHGSFMIYLVFSPLIYKFLVGQEMNRAKEYSSGVLSVAILLSFVWILPQQSSLYCGVFLTGISWLWMSSFWLQFEFPPFRYGLWHAIAVNIGAFGGSVLTYIYI
jgi:hypothetical protein